MIEAYILSFLRHALAAFGTAMVAWLVAHGAKASDAQVVENALIPALMCAAGAYDKYTTHKEIKTLKGNFGNQ